jgi:hypothetical protein
MSKIKIFDDDGKKVASFECVEIYYNQKRDVKNISYHDKNKILPSNKVVITVTGIQDLTSEYEKSGTEYFKEKIFIDEKSKVRCLK